MALHAALLLSALWGALAPFVGPAFGVTLDAQTAARIADHAVPGALSLASGSALMALETRSGPAPKRLAFVAFLGGVWMVGSHLGLVAQALEGEVTYVAMLFHTVPGIFVAASAALLLARSMLRAAD